MYTACVCALCLDFFLTSSSSRCANKSGKWSFLTAGTDERVCCSKIIQRNVTLQFLCSKKKHHLHAIHTLFLCIVSARNLLLSSERDTASGIYAHKEVRAL